MKNRPSWRIPFGRWWCPPRFFWSFCLSMISLESGCLVLECCAPWTAQLAADPFTILCRYVWRNLWQYLLQDSLWDLTKSLAPQDYSMFSFKFGTTGLLTSCWEGPRNLCSRFPVGSGSDEGYVEKEKVDDLVVHVFELEECLDYGDQVVILNFVIPERKLQLFSEVEELRGEEEFVAKGVQAAAVVALWDLVWFA